MTLQESPEPQASVSLRPAQQVPDMQPDEEEFDIDIDIDPQEANRPETVAPSSADGIENQETG